MNKINIAIVDDEPLLLKSLQENLSKFEYIDKVHAFSNGYSLLDNLKNLEVNTAILDVEMPEIDGIALAKKIHEINSRINIIFLTSYSKYAFEAFGVDAISYILKPIKLTELEHALKKCIAIPWALQNESTRPIVTVKTFDGFDVYADGKQIHFPRKKSKELLALLIDKRGASLSSNEAISYLFEDVVVDNKIRENYKKCAYILKKTLKDEGISYILNDNYNSLSVNPSLIKCDYYDLISGDEKAKQLYHGEYMPSFSWAEYTNGFLSNFCHYFVHF